MSRGYMALTLLLCLLTVAASGQSEEERLWSAARRGDTDTIRSLLEHGVDVDVATEYGATALTFASDQGWSEAVKVLLANGADVNARDRFYQVTALHWATINGHAEVVSLLMAGGAKDLAPALELAIERRNSGVVKSLLASPNLDPETLGRGLALAEQAEASDLVALLKAAGAKELPSADVSATTLAGYAGRYKNRLLTMSLTLEEGKLVAHIPGAPPLALRALNATTFNAEEKPELVIELHINDDKVTGMKLGQGSLAFDLERLEGAPTESATPEGKQP